MREKLGTLRKKDEERVDVMGMDWEGSDTYTDDNQSRGVSEYFDPQEVGALGGVGGVSGEKGEKGEKGEGRGEGVFCTVSVVGWQCFITFLEVFFFLFFFSLSFVFHDLFVFLTLFFSI